MLDIALAPMSLAPQTFNAGDTVRVTVSFKYVVGVNTTVKMFAGPYTTNIFGRHMVDTCVGQADISLIAVSTPTPQTADVNFILVPKANGGIDNGTYRCSQNAFRAGSQSERPMQKWIHCVNARIEGERS